MRDHSEELLEKHTIELLDRYFLDALPPSELDALRVALRQSGIRLDAIEQMRRLWQKPSHDELDGNMWADRMAKHLQLDITSSPSRIQEDPSVTAHLSISPELTSKPVPTDHPSFFAAPRALWYTLSSVAAAILLSVVGWQIGTQHTNSSYAGHASVYTTANGQRSKLTLPDGSVVTLNVASRLEVPANYAAGNRTLRLEGEAFFTVQHQHRTPFTVTAGTSTTRVLGTQFVVRHYATDSTALVAVHDGRVAIGSTVLSAQEQAIVGSGNRALVTSAKPGQFTFASGVLTIDSLSLRDAVPELNRWYDTDIRFGDNELAQRLVTGGFPAGALSDLAERLEWTFNARVVRNGRVLTLYTK